ncbi:hypothetical protein PoB_001547500 [Plakobranchus ocellatus]|uniref:Uncharacterized protein n=1 Tax=Plakobranchus ocellatus TaxID=259542 RepID=A0AAV3Z0Q4_9GAST|nr:hypothetical protein PoB_001547500 [Plakobranchus ocellatus]
MIAEARPGINHVWLRRRRRDGSSSGNHVLEAIRSKSVCGCVYVRDLSVTPWRAISGPSVGQRTGEKDKENQSEMRFDPPLGEDSDTDTG